jgi:hypothetical protein
LLTPSQDHVMCYTSPGGPDQVKRLKSPCDVQETGCLRWLETQHGMGDSIRELRKLGCCAWLLATPSILLTVVLLVVWLPLGMIVGCLQACFDLWMDGDYRHIILPLHHLPEGCTCSEGNNLMGLFTMPLQLIFLILLAVVGLAWVPVGLVINVLFIPCIIYRTCVAEANYRCEMRACMVLVCCTDCCMRHQVILVRSSCCVQPVASSYIGALILVRSSCSQHQAIRCAF